MRRSWWIAASFLAAFFIATPLLRRSAEGFDAIVVSGPRRGAFFSCGCAKDRRGGMTLARRHLPGRVLWVEVGNAYGNERGAVRHFLETRVDDFRVEREGPGAGIIRFRDGRRVCLVFADRIPEDELRRLARGPLPLLCVGPSFRPEVAALLRATRDVYVAGDRARRGAGVVGFVGAEGRQVAAVDSNLAVRTVDVAPIAGLPPDPLDLEYLAARHEKAGVLVHKGAALGADTLEDPAQCAKCHPRTVETWRASRHAHALVHLSEGASRTCYGCHSVLRDEPPESAARYAVTCATCHGDTSGHPGGRKLGAARCTGCHTRTASPEFDRAPYWERIRCGE
jgi:hypothetical protein